MILDRGEGLALRNLTDHFRAKEFFCKCGICTTQIIDLEMVVNLEWMRTEIKQPILINSAFRCARHNDVVGGSKESQHLIGKAVDIQSMDVSGMELAMLALLAGFRSIGVGREWIHCDVRKTPEVKLWVYDGLNLDQVRKQLLK